MTIDTTQLRGQYIYLELLTPEPIPVLRQLAKDKRLWQYTRTLIIDEQYDQRFDQYIQTALEQQASGGQIPFVIRRTGDDAILGMTRLYFIEPKDKRAAIGYTWYTPEVWGLPHNKECKLLLLQYLFEVWKLQRVEFHVAHENLRSQKAVEKIGGVKEGVLRKYAIQPDGSIRHTVVFSIIDEEWEEKKKALQQLIGQTGAAK
ncbi:MAG TPA: GNAT family protein [Flavisolibacter sp.]|jgi:RimJ/RimL family protein N-acetyltransferase|nr:GNAT family protein [Flavisolibacter sp.]